MRLLRAPVTAAATFPKGLELEKTNRREPVGSESLSLRRTFPLLELGWHDGVNHPCLSPGPPGSQHPKFYPGEDREQCVP